MTAEIIPFPKTQKQLELETIRDFVSKAKTVIVRNIAQDVKKNDGYHVNGVPVEKPTTGKQYLNIVKQFLEPEDYLDILGGIMDKDHYDKIEEPLQKIVDAYYSFEL